MEGSVDDGSTKSDEEYDDLALLDIPEDGYLTDYDEEVNNKIDMDDSLFTVPGEQMDGLREKYEQNLDDFLRTKSEPLSDFLIGAIESPARIKNERRVSNRVRKRSQSIPALGKHGLLTNVPTSTEALLR